MQHYFAYGSNLHHAQMKRRCPKCRYIKKHILHGYQLAFRSKYGACDIEKKVGKKIYNSKNVSDINVEDVLQAAKQFVSS